MISFVPLLANSTRSVHLVMFHSSVSQHSCHFLIVPFILCLLSNFTVIVLISYLFYVMFTHSAIHISVLISWLHNHWLDFIYISDAHFCLSPFKCQLNPKRPFVPTPLRTLVWLKRFWWSRVPLHCFYGAICKPAVIYQQNSSLSSVQKMDLLTCASGPQRHYVLATVTGHA